MAKTRKDPEVTLPMIDYIALRRSADRWRLLSAVVRNSVKWVDKYGNSVRGDVCRGVVQFIAPLLKAIDTTLDETTHVELNMPPAARAWDLTVVNYMRDQQRD